MTGPTHSIEEIATAMRDWTVLDHNDSPDARISRSEVWKLVSGFADELDKALGSGGSGERFTAGTPDPVEDRIRKTLSSISGCADPPEAFSEDAAAVAAALRDADLLASGGSGEAPGVLTEDEILSLLNLVQAHWPAAEYGLRGHWESMEAKLRAAIRGLVAGEVAAAESGGCPVIRWDGPYSFRCGLGAKGGVCSIHGPFRQPPVAGTGPGEGEDE